MLIFKSFALRNFLISSKLNRHPQRVTYLSQKYLLSIIRSNFENYELIKIIQSLTKLIMHDV